MREGKVRCSFCQKTEDCVRKTDPGPDGAIYMRRVHWHLLRDHGGRIKLCDDEVLNSDINLLNRKRSMQFWMIM